MTIISNVTTKNHAASLSVAGARSTLPYMLIGGGIGAVLALLFAPKSGSEFRTEISDLTRKGYDETLSLAQRLKDQSRVVYQSVMEKKDQVLDIASANLSRAQSKIDATMDAAQDRANGEILELENKSRPRNARNGGGSRKSASIV